MKFAFYSLGVALAFLATGCGTSSTTSTGPSLDRCAITVANSMSSVGPSGGTGRLTVTAGRECTWSVTSNVSWITPRPPAGGQGDGTVDYVVAANPNAEARRGTVAMGGQVLEVVQEGVACRFDLQPTNQNIGAEGGSGSFTVETPSGCSWTPAASHDWITITNGGSQSGNGSVNFNVASNPAGARSGTINVGGQAFGILQSAPLCRYQLSAITGSFGGAGGSGTVGVTAASTCTWTASTNVPWISIVGGASGGGNGTVSFTVQANTGPARNGILTIGSQRFTVTQLQAECNYSISPAGQTFTAGGGQGTVTISTNSVCTWNTSDVPTWVTGMPPSGTGTQAIAFTVEPNPSPERSAAIIIGGQSFAITQTGGCSYSLAPGSHNPPAGGGASSFAVNTAAGCGWTSSGVPAWITGVPASGTGPQTINFMVAANTGVARNANILVGGRTFAVSQPSGCSISLTPGSHNPSAAGGASSVAVNTAAGCGWTSSGVPAWITGVPASGTGAQTINFTVTVNNGATRSANIVIGGQTFTVTQAAVACNYSLNPTSHNAAAAGGSSSVDLTTPASCGWTSSGVPGWITGVPASGTGPQTINFTVAANAGATRSANIIIGGETFAVAQAAVACSYSLNPTSHSASASGGASSFDVNTTAGCDWTSSGVPAWITGVPANGTGTQTINFTVAANPDPTPRSANLTIAGQTFNVSQAAAACGYSLNPTSHNASAAGGSSSFDVNTTASCGWTSNGVPAWITGVPGSGTGTTTINFTVAANPDPSSRNANITIGGQTFTVTQAAAASCSYSLNPTSHNATAGGGTSAFDVNTTAGCNWTSSGVPAWITGVPGNGTGTTTITFTVAANTGSTRNANIVIEGQTFSVTQAAGCSYSLNPTSHNATAGGGTSAFDVNTTAGCNWTSSGVPAWITGVPGNGTSSTTINFTVAANTGPLRSANIVIEGQTFAVSQANGCVYSVSPGQLTFDATGSPEQSIALTAGAGCTWNATPSDSWITIVSGGSGAGNETIRIQLQTHAGPASRSGSVAVGGQTVNITQTFP
jgi:hypothetical protein